MKIIEFNAKLRKSWKKYRIPCENNQNHRKLRIQFENHENHENHTIPFENQ